MKCINILTTKPLWIAVLLFFTFNLPIASADTVEIFSVNANSYGDCNGNVGGTLTIDIGNGTITAADIGLAGIPKGGFCNYVAQLTHILGSMPTAQGWELRVAEDPFYVQGVLVYDLNLILDFNTTNPGSLVGFAGGQITDGRLIAYYEGIVVADYVGGSVDHSAVPEPSSMLLLGTGLAAVAGAVRRRVG